MYVPLILCDFRVLKLQNKGPPTVVVIIVEDPGCQDCGMGMSWAVFYTLEPVLV